jgi:hypothetical protein
MARPLAATTDNKATDETQMEHGMRKLNHSKTEGRNDRKAGEE